MNIPEKLKNKWALKLKNSGFEDIENLDGSLKNSTDPRTIAKALLDKESREAYYTRAQDFIAEHYFQEKIEKMIWSLHANGDSIRIIANFLNLTFYKVQKTIKRLQKLAGLRK